MITTTQMYWLTRLDAVKAFLGHGLAACFTLLAMILMVAAALTFCLGTFTGNGAYETFSGRTKDELESIHARLRRVSARCAVAVLLLLPAGVASSLLDALLPTTREMAAIVMVPAIVNNERVQTVGNKLYDLAAEWLDELRPKKETK